MCVVGRDKVNQKYGFKKHNALDKRQLNLVMWNMVKQMSNNAQQCLTPSSFGCKKPK